jgi:hypothetical protein
MVLSLFKHTEEGWRKAIQLSGVGKGVPFEMRVGVRHVRFAGGDEVEGGKKGLRTED